MPEFAKHVKISHNVSNEYVFEIDGQEFPWYVSEEGVTVGPVARGQMPRITVTIVAETVEVDHSIKQSQDSPGLGGLART